MFLTKSYFVKIVKFLYICPFSKLLIVHVHCTLGLSSYTCSMLLKLNSMNLHLDCHSDWYISNFLSFIGFPCGVHHLLDFDLNEDGVGLGHYSGCLYWWSCRIVDGCLWMFLQSNIEMYERISFRKRRLSFQGITSIFSNQPANLSIGFIVYIQK